VSGYVWGAACLLVGGAFLLNALRLRRQRLAFLSTAMRTAARVVAVRIEGTGRNRVAVPTFEFEASGRTHRAESLQPSGFAGAGEGQTVGILYDPAQPVRADLDTFGALWGLALLRAGFGVLFVMMGLVALLITVL
jgi:hypothetical protein